MSLEEPSVSTQRRLLSLVILCGSLALPLPAGAQDHFDPPGPPPLNVKAGVRDVIVTAVTRPPLNDGADGNSELLLVTTIEHVTHVTLTKNLEIDNLDCPGVPCTWMVRQEILSDKDCTERNPVNATVTLTELDTAITAEAISLLAAAAAALGVDVPPALMNDIVSQVIAGLINAVAGLLNGNEFLGTGKGVVPANGVVVIPTKAVEGAADIEIEGTTQVLADMGQCSSPPPPPHRDPEDEKRRYYEFGLEQSLSVISSITSEPGNPSGLTEEQLRDIRATLLSVAMSMGELRAGAEIEAAQGLQGSEEAIRMFTLARELAVLGEAVTALKLFRHAFFLAAVANQEQVSDPTASVLSFQVSAPRLFSTTANRTVGFPVVVFGTERPVALEITANPAQSDVLIDQLNPMVPVFFVTIELGDVAPGRYDVQVVADDGVQAFTSTVTVVVN